MPRCFHLVVGVCLLYWLGVGADGTTLLAQRPGPNATPYAHLGPRPGANASASATRPHPAVARIVVPERDGTSYGSGTLVDVRDQYGLVVTNWHVVRDATDRIEVVFPDGFRSFGQALKVDADWDLAALVIWRPKVSPVPLATSAPRPGDTLTIAGYGKGTYREVTGHCTQYLSPTVQLPREMVEISVAARQGDSGGPIFNTRGELAGVLWGAGSSTTLGSYVGRVGGFLASVAPHMATGEPQTQFAARLRDVPPVRAPLATHPAAGAAETAGASAPRGDSGTLTPYAAGDLNLAGLVEAPAAAIAGGQGQAGGSAETRDADEDLAWPTRSNYAAAMATNEVYSATLGLEDASHLNSPVFRVGRESKTRRTGELPPTTALTLGAINESDNLGDPAPRVVESPLTWQEFAGESYFDQAKTVLALVGLLATLLFVKRNVGG